MYYVHLYLENLARFQFICNARKCKPSNKLLKQIASANEWDRAFSNTMTNFLSLQYKAAFFKYEIFIGKYPY